LIVILVASGCKSPGAAQPPVTSSAVQTPLPPAQDSRQTCGYEPARVKITPLTEFVQADSEETSQLRIYVDLLDRFDSRIKAPAVFRFELYEYIPRSGKEKGKRIIIWPDIDLTEPGPNNEYWRDFLRCYQFTLDVGEELEEDGSYVLQVTCVTSVSERLNADYIVEYK
jgi:hypothetical protein